MTHLQFTKCMKVLTTLYLKDLNEQELELWYNKLKNVSFEVMNQAIEIIVKECKCFPTTEIVLEKCKKVNKHRILDTLTEMKEDGYFKRGTYGELSEEQEFRNYDKALMWLDKGIIPGFLKEDIKEYMNKSKNKIATDNHKQLTHN